MTEDETRQLQQMTEMIETLFYVSEHFVTEFGEFLPHGAFLSGKDVELLGAATENEITNSLEVLPLLHDGLRIYAQRPDTWAVGVSESVFIGEERTPAIKVMAEHRAGLTLALYRPWTADPTGTPAFGEVQMVAAGPEVGGWL